MRHPRSPALIASLAGVAFAACAYGQRPDEEDQNLALIGLTEVAARVTVQWDMEVTMRGGTTLSDFERNLRRAFELGLSRTGVSMDETAAAHVDCVVTVRYVENADPTVVLSRTVRLSKPDTPEEPFGRWTIGWSRGETRETGRDALSGSEVGRDCAEAFGRDWRQANPKG